MDFDREHVVALAQAGTVKKRYHFVSAFNGRTTGGGRIIIYRAGWHVQSVQLRAIQIDHAAIVHNVREDKKYIAEAARESEVGAKIISINEWRDLIGQGRVDQIVVLRGVRLVREKAEAGVPGGIVVVRALPIHAADVRRLIAILVILPALFGETDQGRNRLRLGRSDQRTKRY